MPLNTMTPLLSMTRDTMALERYAPGTLPREQHQKRQRQGTAIP